MKSISLVNLEFFFYFQYFKMCANEVIKVDTESNISLLAILVGIQAKVVFFYRIDSKT